MAREARPACRFCGCIVDRRMPCCGADAWMNVADPGPRERARLAIEASEEETDGEAG